MPELPEVEAWRKLAERSLVGRILDHAWVRDDRLVFDTQSPRSLQKVLRHRRVVATGRHGKHLWLELDGAGFLTLHFGMTGSLEPDLSPRPADARLVLHSSAVTLTYRSRRRLGRIRLLPDLSFRERLGPDAWLQPLSQAQWTAALAGRQGPIKTRLLDQSVLAGVGNWVADEVLYQSRISPFRPACSLNAEEISRLRRCLRSVLKTAIKVDADASRFPRDWLFHVRWGKAEATTRKGEALRYDTLGGRTTAWVSGVQI